MKHLAPAVTNLQKSWPNYTMSIKGPWKLQYAICNSVLLYHYSGHSCNILSFGVELYLGLASCIFFYLLNVFFKTSWVLIAFYPIACILEHCTCKTCFVIYLKMSWVLIASWRYSLSRYKINLYMLTGWVIAISAPLCNT